MFVVQSLSTVCGELMEVTMTAKKYEVVEKLEGYREFK